MKSKAHTKSIIIAGFLIAASVLLSNNKVTYIMSKIVAAIIPIFAALAVAFFMRPIIKKVHKVVFKKSSNKYAAATLIAYTLVIIFVIIFFKILSGPIYNNALELWSNITSKQFVTLLSERVDSIFGTHSFPFINNIAIDIRQWWDLNLKKILITSASRTSTFILTFFYSIAVSIYISIDYKFIRKWILDHSRKSAEKTNKTLQEITIGIIAWSRGWLKDQAFIFFCTLFAFWILGIQSFLTLAIIMTLFNFIPFIGPIIGGVVIWLYIVVTYVAIPGSLVLNLIFIDSEIIMILSLVAIIIIQTVESLWLIPKVYSEIVAVKPLTILISLVVISTIISPVFSPFTIPIIVIGRIIYKNHFVKK